MRFFAFLALAVPAFACSGVTVAMGGNVILGANNDYRYAADFKLMVEPNSDGLYGRMCIGMETVPGWKPQAMKCINERGLALMHAVTPAGPTPYDRDKPQFVHGFLEKIIAECSTVKQAVNMIRAYSLPESGVYVHLMLADATGDSGVLEWVGDEVKFIPRDGPKQIMTNHLLSKPETATGPRGRYARGSRVLADVKEATVEAVLPVMREMSVYVRLKGQEVGTTDTTIWDLKARRMHVWFHGDFEHPLVFDLDAETAKGSRLVSLKDLFPNAKPSDLTWRDENGPVKRTVPGSN